MKLLFCSGKKCNTWNSVASCSCCLADSELWVPIASNLEILSSVLVIHSLRLVICSIWRDMISWCSEACLCIARSRTFSHLKKNIKSMGKENLWIKLLYLRMFVWSIKRLNKRFYQSFEKHRIDTWQVLGYLRVNLHEDYSHSKNHRKIVYLSSKSLLWSRISICLWGSWTHPINSLPRFNILIKNQIKLW